MLRMEFVIRDSMSKILSEEINSTNTTNIVAEN